MKKLASIVLCLMGMAVLGLHIYNVLYEKSRPVGVYNGPIPVEQKPVSVITPLASSKNDSGVVTGVVVREHGATFNMSPSGKQPKFVSEQEVLARNGNAVK